jgi:arylsulfatase
LQRHPGKYSLFLFSILAAALVSGVVVSRGALSASEAGRPDSRPNILLIVADDLGYADLGAYGSDIRTPNIDLLASQGILFTGFHTGPMCAPTRSMLLSGNNNHVAGMARQSPGGLPNQYLPGYEGHLSDRIAPLPRLLRTAGYHTYMAGKWHLGIQRENSPQAAGFERSFGLVDGAGNHWDGVGFFEGASTYREDGVEIEWPEGRYSTALYTDKLIEYMQSGQEDGKPFFAFAAYTSPHWPLQVPEDELNRYAGSYDAGYDALRQQRFESLKSAGIIPASSEFPPRFEDIPPWEALDPEQQRRESRKMELYAAMVENLDGHVGRLVGFLKKSGLYENTLIVFMSDNGAAAEDFYYHEYYGDYLREHFNNDYENMGKPSSWVSYGPQWAEAGSAPFKRHKGYVSEGGIAAPMIISGKDVAKQGFIENAYLTVMDLAPTFLEKAGAHYPDDGSVRPMLGESMSGLLTGDASFVHDQDYVTTLFHAGRAYVRKGGWKLLQNQQPFDAANFALFNMDEDPGEIHDLKETHPEKFKEMVELWQSQRIELGIVLPEDL